MMYAIVKTGGKQVKVSGGEVLKVEKLPGEVGDTVTLDEVLALSLDDGEFRVGAPVVAGATVTARILEQGKGKKVIVFKFKSKVNYRRKKGHRQPYTKIQIEKINT